MINFETLDTIREKLEKVKLNESNQKIYSRVEALVNLAQNRLHSEYAIFLNDTEEQNLNVYFKNIVQTINNDIVNPENAFFNNLPPLIQNSFNILKLIPVDTSNSTKQNLSQIITNFQKRSINQTTKYEQKLSELEEIVKQLSTKVREKDSEVTALTAKFQQQFADAQEKRLTEFSDLLKVEEGKFSDKFKDIDEKSEEFISKLQERDNKSLGLLGKIAGRVFGEFYTGASNKAKWLGHLLFGLAFAYMLVLSYHIFGLILSSKMDLNWHDLFYKTIVLLPLYIPAGYLIFEANRQRDKEEKYQELGMRISASAPYLERIEEELLQSEKGTEELDKLRLELAKKFFGENTNDGRKNKVLSKKEILRLVKEILAVCRREKEEE